MTGTREFFCAGDVHVKKGRKIKGAVFGEGVPEGSVGVEGVPAGRVAEESPEPLEGEGGAVEAPLLIDGEADEIAEGIGAGFVVGGGGFEA